MIFSLLLLSHGSGRVWPPPTRGDAAQAAANFTLPEANPRPTSSRQRVSSPGPDSRRWATYSSHPSRTVRSRHHIISATARRCQQMPSSTDGHSNPNSPSSAASSPDTNRLTTSASEQLLLAGLMDRAASHWVEHLRSVEPTKTQTQELTPQRQMMTMTTSPPSPASKLHPSRLETCDRCSRTFLGAVCSLMFQHFLELEVFFEDHGVCSGAITDSLVLERAVYEQPALLQPLPSAAKLTSRQRGVQFLLDLTVTCALPVETSEFAQPNEVTQPFISTSNCTLLRSKVHRSLPEPLTTFAALPCS